MSKKSDGGPAFPKPDAIYTEEQARNGIATLGNPGMSLRDYFAAKALTGLIAAEADGEGGGAFTLDEGKLKFATKPAAFAVAAYQLADAMLAARGGK